MDPNNNNNNSQEIHPLLRLPLNVINFDNFPKITISDDEKELILSATGPCSPSTKEPIPPMVTEAMRIIEAHTPQMQRLSKQWLVTYAGLLSRYHELGYIDFEPVA